MSGIDPRRDPRTTGWRLLVSDAEIFGMRCRFWLRRKILWRGVYRAWGWCRLQVLRVWWHWNPPKLEDLWRR